MPAVRATFARSRQRRQVRVTSSDAVWVLSKQYALVHESVDLHADHHRIVVLQPTVICQIARITLLTALSTTQSSGVVAEGGGGRRGQLSP